jgi:hypothetical protein
MSTIGDQDVVEVDCVKASWVKCDLECQVISQNEIIVARYQCDGGICQAEALKASIRNDLPACVAKLFHPDNRCLEVLPKRYEFWPSKASEIANFGKDMRSSDDVAKVSNQPL